MTLIKRLTAKGFKSFATKTELVFGDKFNCILGPNGSGKSNVVDAICFVLGKGSAKGLRAEKSASLIYHGGKKGKSSPQAEVSMTFENKERSFPIEDEEVTITRIVKKNGTSTYKINDIVRTRQQFIEFLHSAKIDPDGHNIVLQGDVIAFTDMKPIPRREILEEVAGISTYEERKNKCLRELGKVDAKLNEAEIILVEREKNLKELKKERDQAKRYKELEEDLKSDKATLINFQIKQKQEKLDEVEKRKKDYNSKIEKINKGIESIREKIGSWQETISEINKKFEEEGEQEQILVRKQIDELKEDVVKTKSRSEVCFSEVSKINSRQTQLKIVIQELEKKVKDFSKQKTETESKLKNLEKEGTQLEKDILNFKSEHGIESNAMDILEEMEKELDSVADEVSDIKEQKQTHIRSKDQLEYQIKNLDDQISNLKGEGKSQEAQALKSNRQEYKKTILELEKQVSKNIVQNTQLSETRKEIYRKENELAKLKTKQLTIQEFSMGDRAVRKILELRNENKGIIGTVSELGEVDSKFSKALNVAAGGRIHSVVVDSDLTAKNSIERLRERKYGVVRFLPLNKIKPRVANKNIKEHLKDKNVHGLAIDLITFDSKYKNIFSYIFGDTLIVEDIATARKIGIGKARMITLEGDLMEPSGAMVGGYRVRSSSGFKEKQIDQGIEKTQKELSQLRKNLEEVEPKKTDTENSINKLREEKATLEGEIIKLEKALNIDGNKLGRVSDERDIIAASIKKVDQDIKELDIQLSNKEKEFLALREKRAGLKHKLNNPDIIKNIEDLENKKLDLRERKITHEGEIKTINAQLDSMIIPEKERTEKIIKQHEKELAAFKIEIQDLKEILKNKERELKGKEKEEAKFRTDFKEQIEKRNKLSDMIKEKETEIAIQNEKIRGNENKINELAIDRARFLAELEGLNKELEPYADAKLKRNQSPEDLRNRIRDVEREISKIGNVNLRALEVYDEIQVEYEKVLEKVAKLKSEKGDVLSMMEEIELRKIEVFKKTFAVLNKNFKRIFLSLSNKGEASLELENKENPFEGGVNIRVKLLSGKYMDLKGLSGGEKTMTALAFIFSIQEYEPSAFYLLDEVDAALDKRNSELLSKLVAKYADRAQYLIISHNDTVITEADQIYGVSMQDGVSKVVSLRV